VLQDRARRARQGHGVFSARDLPVV